MIRDLSNNVDKRRIGLDTETLPAQQTAAPAKLFDDIENGPPPPLNIPESGARETAQGTRSS
jgi:hypothetical protein